MIYIGLNQKSLSVTLRRGFEVSGLGNLDCFDLHIERDFGLLKVEAVAGAAVVALLGTRLPRRVGLQPLHGLLKYSR